MLSFYFIVKYIWRIIKFTGSLWRYYRGYFIFYHFTGRHESAGATVYQRLPLTKFQPSHWWRQGQWQTGSAIGGVNFPNRYGPNNF